MDSQGSSVAVLRGLLLCLAAAYASTLYVELGPHQLSAEATQYRHVVSLTKSGFGLNFAAQKISWTIGSGFAVLGATLMFLRNRLGLILMAVSAPILCVAALLGASSSAYPDTESTISILLWFVTGANWGCVLTYALLRRELLFLNHAQCLAQRDDVRRRV